MDRSARLLDVEAEPTELRYDSLHGQLARRSPLVLKIEQEGGPQFVCVLSAGRYVARLLIPGGRKRFVRTSDLCDFLRARLEDPERLRSIAQLLARTNLSTRQERRLRTTYLRQAVGN